MLEEIAKSVLTELIKKNLELIKKNLIGKPIIISLENYNIRITINKLENEYKIVVKVVPNANTRETK